jgi:hypothetical protein
VRLTSCATPLDGTRSACSFGTLARTGLRRLACPEDLIAEGPAPQAVIRIEPFPGYRAGHVA